MSREILFRGKRTDNGDWVYGNHLYDDVSEKHYIIPFGNITESDKVGQEECTYCVGFEVIPETVGQYTGLCDKSGKKIFEGDIIADFETNNRYVVEWEKVMACFIFINTDDCKNDSFCGVEILDLTEHKVYDSQYDKEGNLRQYRTKIVRKIRSSIFRQIV